YSSPGAHRLGVRRPVSLRDPQDTESDAARTLLRAPERAQAPRADGSPVPRHRPVLVGVVVRWLERRRVARWAPATRHPHGRRAADMDVARGVDAYTVRLLFGDEISAGLDGSLRLSRVQGQGETLELGGQLVVDVEPAGVVATEAFAVGDDVAALDPVPDRF